MANVTGYWLLNDTPLTASGVTVKATQNSGSRKMRVANESLHNDGEYHEAVGVDDRRRTFEFIIVGRGVGKYPVLTTILSTVETGVVWSLEAPVNQYVDKTSQKAYFLTEGTSDPRQVGPGKEVVTVNAILMGTGAADGGAFSQQFAYIVEMVSNSFYAASNSAGFTDTPLVGFPLQGSGYPIGTNPTTFAETAIAASAKKYLVAALDGSSGVVEVDSIAGYVSGTPHAGGVSGTAYIEESAA